MTNELTKHVLNRSIDDEVDTLLGFAANVEALDLLTATTRSGLRYVRDDDKDITVVAGPNAIVKQSCATYKIMVARPGASREEVLADLKEFTQELRGTVVGRSQSWVSLNDTE